MNNNRVLYHTVLYLASCGLKQSYSISRSSSETFLIERAYPCEELLDRDGDKNPPGEKGPWKRTFLEQKQNLEGPPRGGGLLWPLYCTQPKTAGALSQSVVSRIPYKWPPPPLFMPHPIILSNWRNLKLKFSMRERKTEINHIILVSLHTVYAMCLLDSLFGAMSVC